MIHSGVISWNPVKVRRQKAQSPGSIPALPSALFLIYLIFFTLPFFTLSSFHVKQLQMPDLSTPCLHAKSVCVCYLERSMCLCVWMICVRVMSVCVSASLHEALLFAPFVLFFLSHLNRKADLEFGCETGTRHEGRRVSVCLHFVCTTSECERGDQGWDSHCLLHSLFSSISLSHISISVPVRQHHVLIVVLPVNLH